MYNYKLTIQYDGTRYRGWQVQGNTDLTIQGKLEGVLSRLTGQLVEVHGSGRTDAGVHALGQVANVKLPHPVEPSELLGELNRYLPADIGVIAAEPAPERFHARLNARSKTYRYRIWNSEIPNVLERSYLYPLPEPLDVAAMERAAADSGGHPRFPQLLRPETVQEIHRPHHHRHLHHTGRCGSAPGVHRQRLFDAHGAHFGGDAGGSGVGTAGGGLHAGCAGRPRPCCRWACVACPGVGVGLCGLLIYMKRRFPEGNRLLFCLEGL